MYFLSFINAQLSNSNFNDHKESEYNQKRENVYSFLRLPWALEKFMTYGFLQCVDSFLYICTFLPLRILKTLFQAFHNPFALIANIRKALSQPSNMIDFCKLTLILTCYYLLTFIDTSMVYHIIRGQAIMKLYIFFNMLEVADRLLCTIGHDVMEALFWTATEPKKPKYLVLPHLFFSIVYVFCHTFVILCETTTLNVAFNSHNKALLTIMLSNNFIELKSSVFKKFDKNNLFQLSCYDVKERFHNLVYILIIFIRNMAEFDWQNDQLFELIPTLCIIFFSEFFIDWIKHGFVMKFNDINESVFYSYRMILANDLINSRQRQSHNDHIEFQSMRYGFMPIPLFCLLFRICTQSVKLTNHFAFFNIIVFYLCLLSLKILNDIILLGLSCNWIVNDKKARSNVDSLKMLTFSSEHETKKFNLKKEVEYRDCEKKEQENEDEQETDYSEENKTKKNVRKRSFLISKLMYKRLIILTTAKSFSKIKKKIV